ncbi:MAG: hypothetical protein NWQ38_07910 [Cellulophaga sp.]|nr:hypothetical protein [Cellulophaga sp.]
MEENNSNDFDIFLTKAIKEVGLEAPSENFTNNIMAKVSLKEETKIRPYEPLISNVGWLFILSSFALVMLTMMFYQQDKEDISSVTPIFDSIFNIKSVDAVFNIEISEVTSYAVLGLVFFLYVQVYLVKKFRNKQFAV